MHLLLLQASLRKTTRYIVGRSPTPIVIYNVEGELDFLATKDDDRQNLDDARKLDDSMMRTRGGDGK